MKAQRLSPRARRLVAAAATTAAVFSSGLSASTAANAATPDTFQTCTTGSSSGNVNTCLSVNGTGSYISQAVASATVINSERWLLVCMFNPSNIKIGCSNDGSFVPVRPGPPITFPWHPNSHEPTGAYCAYTWRQNSDGTETLVGKTCVSVIG